MAGAEDGGRVALSERGEAGQFGNQFSGDLLKRNIEFVSFARDEHGVIIACFKTSVEFKAKILKKADSIVIPAAFAWPPKRTKNSRQQQSTS